jgi:hypothetical protein
LENTNVTVAVGGDFPFRYDAGTSSVNRPLASLVATIPLGGAVTLTPEINSPLSRFWM